MVLADTRWYLDGRSGHAAYLAGHLPGAVFVDLDSWVAGPSSDEAGRNPLPDHSVFAEGMAQLGIGDDDVVVAYDDAGGVIAARLVWMLRVTGHRAAVLDGGLAAADVGLEVGPVRRPRAAFTAARWPAERVADLQDVASREPSVAVVDARDPARFDGQADPVDPRPGHIPGAVNVPCRSHLDGDGRLLPVDRIKASFLSAGIVDATDVISSCGSGVTACHNLLALEHAGLGQGRLYRGSWSQWSRRADLPVATGTSTTPASAF
ncbi:sulfurtransferase [Nocardioides sp. SYSU D00065]|uniref:sulfurtransferase n=1 Tax=Nocardioides sp. SYSU D00065 TaxID=2817378 RepID=UPI001B31E412|nr:sulfurtransferase [Nocardioides sp. SYSU D00065]